MNVYGKDSETYYLDSLNSYSPDRSVTDCFILEICLIDDSFGLDYFPAFLETNL